MISMLQYPFFLCRDFYLSKLKYVKPVTSFLKRTTNNLFFLCSGVTSSSNFGFLRRARQKEDFSERTHLHKVQLSRNVGKAQGVDS
jgi:hypothetical protein